jgi:hypothetical protein
MAYTLPNIAVKRVGNRPRYVWRDVTTIPVGSNGSAAATAQIGIPHPGRLIAIKTVSSATQAGTLVIKRDTTDGVQIFTDGDISSDVALSGVGTTNIAEDAAAAAATDCFSGGFPVVSGVHLTYASANAVAHKVSMLFRLCTYFYVDLVSQSGADGSGVVTKFVDLSGPGVLTALQVDYQNVPVTTDILIKNDSTDGDTLFTRTSSATDIAPKLLGAPGLDEAINVTAATDGTEAANGFHRGLFFDIAQSDAFTSSNERIIIECWCDQ